MAVAREFPAIVPHKSDESLLIRYVSGADEKLIMPPTEPRLTAEQVGLLRTWIDQGAVWPDDGSDEQAGHGVPDGKDHWAFQPRTHPEPPAVRDDGLRERVRNPIDNFVFAKLEENGWQPNPRAKPHQLLASRAPRPHRPAADA